MEPPSTAASSELMRSEEDDEECILLRGQLAEEDQDDKGNSPGRSFESKKGVIDGHIGADSCSSMGHCSYTVTCTVSIALAIPRGDKDNAVTTVEKSKKKTKKILSGGLVEAPKTKSYYHIEYNLLPGTSEPIKVDLVMFGLAAKVYMEDKTKVLEPWLDGDQVWLGWSQCVKLNLSKELLVKMSSHKITFRVWDTKDRVSLRAKYDRPKAFRLPLDRSTEDQDQTVAALDCEAEGFGGVKSLVNNLRAVHDKEKRRARSSLNVQRENLSVHYKPSEVICATVDCKLSTMKAPSSVPLNVGESKEQETEQLYSQREETDGRTEEESIKKGILDQEKHLVESVDHCTISQKDTTTIFPRSAYKVTQENTEEAGSMCKNCVASAELSAMYLVAGDRSLTGCFLSSSKSFCEGFCSIVLDQPLMSEKLKAELNPLVITILSASSLPSSPVPFNELQEKCLPVYCQYKFHNMPVHRTKGHRHGPHIYFRDVNVILTGLLNAEELQEFLRGPMIEIEVHDRDRKTKKPLIRPAIFGTEPGDDKLATAALATTRRTAHHNKLHDSYGIAKLNLSDLLRGHRCLNLSLPIRCSHGGRWMGVEKNDLETKLPEKADVLDESQGNSLPMGHYIEANSKLKVQVEITRPLVPDPDLSEGRCPFGRVVYIFNYNDIHVLTKLRSEILRVNVAAFQLDSYAEETAQKVLGSYRMSAKERMNKNLNAVTGFHMLDKSLHLFVLEGLKEQAIKQLWETVPIQLDEDVEKQVIVLYNSGLSFSERLYDSLDIGLNPVHLHQPLDTILKEPLVYIRDMISYTCLQALLRIKHLCQAKNLEEVILNDLFPSAKMILSLKQELGKVPTRGAKSSVEVTKDSQYSSHHCVSRRRMRTPLDTFNKDYLQWKQTQADQGLHAKNYVQANIEEVCKASRGLPKPKPKVFVAEVKEGQSSHNYSIQKLNCTTLAHELLRKEMAKVPARRFSYNQHYHSFTVYPVDMEADYKASTAKSRAAWRTFDGFIYPGPQSSIESNRHPKQPDEARVEELRKPWRENHLHSNKLSPTLNRCRWIWNQRHKDFELYFKPSAVFSPEPPISIHLAGESLRQEQLQDAQAQYSRWLMKILPDKHSAGSGRVPEFKCHMRRDGLNKLQDLLKDKPMKLSLKRTWRALKPPPVFAMDHQTNTCSRGIENKSTSAGPFWNHTSLQLDTNPNPVGYSKSQFGRWRLHPFQHRRAALPLTAEAEKQPIFQKPLRTPKTAPVHTQLRSNITETRINSVTVPIY